MGDQFDWAKLAAFSQTSLGWQAEQFWQSTPYEFWQSVRFAYPQLAAGAHAPVSRAELARLRQKLDG